MQTKLAASMATAAAVAGVLVSVAGAQNSTGPANSVPPHPASSSAVRRPDRVSVADGMTSRESRSAFHRLSRNRAAAVARKVLRERHGDVSDPAGLGIGADDYVNDYWARLNGEGEDHALVTSTLPMFVREDGHRRPVDLDVRPDGSGFISARPLIDVRYPARADGSVRLGQSGVRMSADTASASEAELVSGRVVYPNAGSDMDQVFAPTPTGFQVLWQLRSPAAPTVLPLRVSMPAGAKLSLVETPNTSAPAASKPSLERGSVVIAKAGKVLATIAAPATTDAAGRAVATHYELHGDTLQTVVETAGQELTFPLLVDPDVRDTYDGARLAASAQWAFGQYTPAGSNGFAPGRVNNSLSVGAYGNAYYVDGAQGYWLWRAPAGSALTNVNFTGVNHAYVASQFFSGILNPTASGYESGPFYYPYALSNASSSATSTNPGEGNFAVAGLRMPGTGVRGGSAFMYFTGATLTVRDNHPPVSSLRAIPSADWTNYRWGGIGFDLSDSGLGLKSVSVTGAADESLLSSVQNLTCTGIVQPCPTTGNSDGYSGFGYSRQLPYDLDALGEGARQVHVSVRDVAGNGSYSGAWTARYDKTPPQVTTVSGTLADAAGSAVGTGPYTLRVTATDGDASAPARQRSGVKNIAVLVDGVTRQTTPAQSCPASVTSCPLTTTFTLTADDLGDEGEHTISIVARDQLDQPSTPNGTSTPATSFKVVVDRTPPQIFPEGPLWDSDGAMLSDDSMSVDLDATDGDDENPSSGVRFITVSVDELEVARYPATGCGTTNCTASANYVFPISAQPDGLHTITYTTTDRAGLTDTVSETVEVHHIDQQPPSSQSAASAAVLRIDGAQGGLLGAFGDRAGSAVADIGDVNDDGVDDYAIGAPGAAPALRINGGAVYVVYGGQTGTVDLRTLSPAQGYEIEGANVADAAGTAVAAAGDLNGDGIQDMVIGAPGAGLTYGHAYLLFGGRCRQTVDLAALGTCGFVINGPSPQLGDLLTNALPFGGSLGGPHTGALLPSADVNGDELDDIVLGSPRTGSGAGAAYVVFGKTDGEPVSLDTIGTGGFRIDGPPTASGGAPAQAGTASTTVGDVNADGLADIAIGAPGMSATGPGETSPRAGSGEAFVVLGKTDVQSVSLGSTGSAAYPILGAPGDAVGRSISALGDFDSDGLNDIALGGHGAFIVLGQDDDSTEPLDLGDPAYPRIRIAAPSDAGSGTATVAAGNDLNGDILNDLLISYPQTGSSYAVFTQDGLRNLVPPDLALNSAPGQQVARYTASATGDGTGTALDEIDQLADGRPGLVVGAPSASPNGRAAAGSVFVMPSSQAAAPQPKDGIAVGDSIASPQPVVGQAIRRRGCVSSRGWQFIDRPRIKEGVRQTQDVNFYDCRRASGGTIDKTQRLERCGYLHLNKKKCPMIPKTEAQADRFRAQFRLRKRLVDDDTSGDDVTDNMVVVDSTSPYSQDPGADGKGPEYAWTILDSLNKVIGYVRETPHKYKKNVQIGIDTEVPTGVFRVWNDTKQFIGTTGLGPQGFLQIEGRPCAKSPDLAAKTALLYLVADSDQAPASGNSATVRGLLPRAALAEHALSKRFDNKTAINKYWAPCRKPDKLKGALGSGTYTPPTFHYTADVDRYLGGSKVATRKGRSATKALFSAAGTTYLNFTFPHRNPADPGASASYPSFATMVASTASVSAGGFARGIVRGGTTVNYLDSFSYLDPNIPCDYPESASWNLIEAGGVYAWVPRAPGDGNSAGPPVPAPRPKTSTDPKAIIESSRTCKP